MKPKVKPTVIKSPSKPYTCSNCNKAFAWGKDSWWYGKQEYETKQKEREQRKFFCSTKCKEEFKINP
jgi:endogenous inhibitor of DNA gyrase (YacG/DUF329 family)